MLEWDLIRGNNLHFIDGISNLVLWSWMQISEPGICRGNEDSHRNENRKLRKNIFSVGKKIDKHTHFLWKLRWWICECKLKVQHWYSSWIVVCYISSNLPQIAQILVSTFKISWGEGEGEECAPRPPLPPFRNFLFSSLAIPGSEIFVNQFLFKLGRWYSPLTFTYFV